jgi:hypothetical protein
MIITCCKCKKWIGDQAPFSDTQVIYGICDLCLVEFKGQLEESIKLQFENKQRYQWRN